MIAKCEEVGDIKINVYFFANNIEIAKLGYKLRTFITTLLYKSISTVQSASRNVNKERSQDTRSIAQVE